MNTRHGDDGNRATADRGVSSRDHPFRPLRWVPEAPDSRGVALLSLLVTLVAGIALFGGVPGGGAIGIGVALTAVWFAASRAIARGLPEHPRIEPAPPGDLLPETIAAIGHLQRLGFVPLGGAQQANVVPAPIVLPFVHRDRGTLAAVQELRTPRGRVVVDFVTEFVCGAVLTTSNAREAATLPPCDGQLLQTVHGAAPDALSACHREGVATLRAMGRRTVSTADTTLADFVHRMVSHLRAQRDAFDDAPVRTTTVAVWRTLFGCRRHARPLAEQVAGGAELAAGAANG